MATFRMEDGAVVNTEKASKHWSERSDHDGRNFIGRSSGSQWHDQDLYRSRKGRYYLVYGSRVQGQSDHAEWISPQEAFRWLLLNERTIPDELEQYREELEE